MNQSLEWNVIRVFERFSENIPICIQYLFGKPLEGKVQHTPLTYAQAPNQEFMIQNSFVFFWGGGMLGFF